MVHASIALMGLCSSTARAPSEQDLQAQRLLQGAAKAYLGPAADGTPDGVVPYLLTAIGSGGQFLYVDASQTEHAADILQAQITHSAGAGAWSDYVSDQATYRWDDLATWEYNWIDASPTNGGTNWGTPTEGGGYLDVTIPGGFSYYGGRGYTLAHVYEDGYMVFGTGASVADNTTLPNPIAPNNALYPYWDDLAWKMICRTAEAPQACGLTGEIYSKSEGDWFAIEHANFYPWGYTGDYNTFEVLLNASTGEIRYQYHTLPNGAVNATIGLENWDGSDGVQVSYNTIEGASEGEGYKFTPAPPQPTKTYTVAVDSLMQGVGFLLTGYSGTFEDLVVRYPDDTLVDCNDTENVLCLNLGLVQYVQADVDGCYGEWEAVVDAGPSGSGTFSFFNMAASAISVESPSDHTLSTLGGIGLQVNLGQALDGNALTGWFIQPDGSPFGPAFPLYDDGAHGDGFAGDGRFGSAPYTPPGAGTGYLWVRGALGGVEFRRHDRVPFTFQPLSITSLGDGVNMGGATELEFELRNDDVHDHCYWYRYQVPEGWWLDGLPEISGFLIPVCLDAGQTLVQTVQVYMGPGYTNDLPSGTSGEVILSIVEWEEGVMSDSASARVRRHRPPSVVDLFNPTDRLRPDGDTTTMECMVLDDQNVIVADGTEVQLSATLGTMSPTVGTTQGGFFRATFTSGATEGTAVVTAQTDGISDTAEIEISSAPRPNQIALDVSTSYLLADGASTAALTATVLDRWKEPVANQIVRIGVEGDGQMGTVDGGEVVSGTTNAQGQLSATYTSGNIVGQAAVRAELMTPVGTLLLAAYEDRQVITLGGGKTYLPIILRMLSPD
jgi:hypothetical protein